MKSCNDRVEINNAGMRLWWFWHRLFILLLEQTVYFTTKRVCKIQVLTRVCNQFSMITLRTAKLRIYNGKSGIVMRWNIARGKRAKAPSFDLWDTAEYLLEKNIIQMRFFFQIYQTSQLQLNTLVFPIQRVQ